MADCKKCDRCGEYYDLFDKNGHPLPVLYRRKIQIGKSDMDLCSACFKQFLEFMGVDDDDA